jgi:hypothetical protein
VLTADLVPVCRHEPLISNTTNADDLFPTKVSLLCCDRGPACCMRGLAPCCYWCLGKPPMSRQAGATCPGAALYDPAFGAWIEKLSVFGVSAHAFMQLYVPSMVSNSQGSPQHQSGM